MVTCSKPSLTFFKVGLLAFRQLGKKEKGTCYGGTFIWEQQALLFPDLEWTESEVARQKILG